MAIKLIASDFGICGPALQNWLRKADVEERIRPSVNAEQNAELPGAK